MNIRVIMNGAVYNTRIALEKTLEIINKDVETPLKMAEDTREFIKDIERILDKAKKELSEIEEKHVK